ncbi:hypothetical protein DL766_007364 [Monosporascus sp. MC13-8B]|uniref:Rhodopsin domain-containing protein n=1 Tax=Monosporascus cannonballus TaxID=155416 RepID=A0ABY0GYS9_9PEZI|nr:hypothetical protein DL762_007619 [Monosporascus cannonballus]RYO85233.1 hypothetical protein DL763_007174 [Monosporascus cannonballus]RYP24107.1 hypothetical protein DL766_007364 [Monosporascus sp. MC13-8B]
MGALVGINSVAIGLRILVRTRISKAFGYNDVILCVAFVGLCLTCAMAYGSLAFGYGRAHTKPEYDQTTATKFYVVCQITYLITLFVVKFSVAIVLYRLAECRNTIRRILQGSMIVLGIWGTVSVLIVALECLPLSVAWGVGDGNCVHPIVLANTGYSTSAIDIATGWLFALLPIALLWNVQLNTTTKVSVILLLGLGVLYYYAAEVSGRFIAVENIFS